MKNSYQDWLQPYEDWLRSNRPIVLQQQEIENGGPYIPSPAPVKSQQGNPTAMGTPSPAMRASVALNASIEENYGPTPTSAAVPSVEAPSRTTVSAGGFTTVNAPAPASGFSAINAPNGMYREAEKGSIDAPLSLPKNTPDLRST